MLHRRHVTFWGSIENVADKEVLDGMTLRQERRAILDLVRAFTHHS
ncbi:hypothetical protein [Rhodopirellula sp. UBA1907]|nr:hypothetical protein [Rhodopirellula sp. UBA1907]